MQKQCKFSQNSLEKRKIIFTFALAIAKIDASLAQLVEHDTLNVGVQGSSPWGGTKGKED